MGEVVEISAPVEHVRVITINRPESRNALNDAAILAIRHALREFRELASPPGLVVRGRGDLAFSAGSDIKELAQQGQRDRERHTRYGQALTEETFGYPGLVIAAIEGYCLGGGLELAVACDLRLVGESSTLGLPEVTINSLPSWGGTVRVPSLIGIGRSKELVLFGEMLSARRAVDWGLASEVCQDGTTTDAAVERLTTLYAGASRSTIARAKTLVNAWPHVPNVLALELEYLADAIQLAQPEFERTFGNF